jgi:carboxyl-terminal processing protease
MDLLKRLRAACLACCLGLAFAPGAFAQTPADLTPAQFTKAWNAILARSVSGIDVATMAVIAVESVEAEAKNPPTFEPKTGVAVKQVLAFVEAARRRAPENRNRPLLRTAMTEILHSLEGDNHFDLASNFYAAPAGVAGATGLTLTRSEGVVTVVRVDDGSPASLAGVMPDDHILRIDGTPVGPELKGVIERLRGQPGTMVTVALERAGGSAPIEVTLTRTILPFGRVVTASNGAITRLALRGLSDRSADELSAAIAGHASSDFILDLRGNSGGLLQGSVSIADLFLSGGLVLSVHENPPGTINRYNARPGDIAQGRRIVVLVDRDTASGAEVIAAALRDRGRAVLVGTRTAGAGTVSTVVPLGGDDLLTVVTGRMFPPSERSFDKVGLAPDVVVPAAGDAAARVRLNEDFPSTGPLQREALEAAIADRADVSTDLAALGAAGDDAAVIYAVRLLKHAMVQEAAGPAP